ncbi:MAG: hypothetical protein AAFQ94_28725 [Bacteroidota bacterium]
MTNTEIKKATYKEKPDAHFKMIRSGIAYYYADLKEQRVHYEIPVNDMGTVDFTPIMEAKLLNRWIVNVV